MNIISSLIVLCWFLVSFLMLGWPTYGPNYFFALSSYGIGSNRMMHICRSYLSQPHLFFRPKLFGLQIRHLWLWRELVVDLQGVDQGFELPIGPQGPAWNIWIPGIQEEIPNRFCECRQYTKCERYLVKMSHFKIWHETVRAWKNVHLIVKSLTLLASSYRRLPTSALMHLLKTLSDNEDSSNIHDKAQTIESNSWLSDDEDGDEECDEDDEIDTVDRMPSSKTQVWVTRQHSAHSNPWCQPSFET